MTNEQFINELEKLNIKLNEVQLKQLETYYEMLVEWNSFMNLTGITEKKQVYLKHYYDSLTICKAVDLNKEATLCDIGTGAGFPGLVLKICFPHLKVVLVDSLQKRIAFLNTVIEKLGLTEIETIHERAEEYSKKVREKYDIVTARAVSNINILIEYCLPLIKPNKYFIAMKGNITEEIKNLPKALNKIKGDIVSITEFNLPIEESIRNIIVITKKDKTDIYYPRKYLEIKNKPL